MTWNLKEEIEDTGERVLTFDSTDQLSVTVIFIFPSEDEKTNPIVVDCDGEVTIINKNRDVRLSETIEKIEKEYEPFTEEQRRYIISCVTMSEKKYLMMLLDNEESIIDHLENKKEDKKLIMEIGEYARNSGYLTDSLDLYNLLDNRNGHLTCLEIIGEIMENYEENVIELTDEEITFYKEDKYRHLVLLGETWAADNILSELRGLKEGSRDKIKDSGPNYKTILSMAARERRLRGIH